MPKLSERTEADTNLAGRARQWHAEGTRWAMRARSQETAGKDRGGSAGYTEASLPRKNDMPGQTG